MMTSIVEETTPPVSNIRVVPPSVLLIGKKNAVNYIAPGLFRLNNTGELVIKATGSLSIVTAVDVAELIKRDVENVLSQTISLGTDSLMISTGETKRMSCIEIRLAKVAPVPEPVEPVAVVVPSPGVELPAAPAKKTVKRKRTTVARKKKSVRKKKTS